MVALEGGLGYKVRFSVVLVKCLELPPAIPYIIIHLTPLRRYQVVLRMYNVQVLRVPVALVSSAVGVEISLSIVAISPLAPRNAMAHTCSVRVLCVGPHAFINVDRSSYC